jgi:carboxypeptidase Taq
MNEIDSLKSRLYDINAIGSALGIMSWDQQCLMPPGAAEARAAHLGILARMHHEMLVADETQRALEAAEAVAESAEVKAICRVTRRQLDQETKFPSELVEKLARLGAEAHEKWVEARANNDFKSFAPYLEQMFDIAKEQAECLGYKDHIYDALFDMYEEGAVKADADTMFNGIREPLTNLIKDIQESGNQPDDSFLTSDWPEADQSAFTEKLVRAIGYDFNRGRQDTAPHPFCTGWSVNDIRITTRFQSLLNSAVFGSLHEAGHGMYEQGSPNEWDRLPIAGGVSLGVHESQSRLWENIVGRSRPFWEHFYPSLQQTFPELQSRPLDEFHRAVNKAKPSLIRVEADEVTYNMHIMVRFELECALLSDEIQVKDLPDAWNAMYVLYLGVTPESDANGCMQDVHWSGGMIGYFPTYSMGNLLSAQIWKVLVADLGDVDEMMREGNFAPILDWLTEKIYSKGSIMTPKELITQVTGKPMGPEDYLVHIEAKYRGLYGLN